MDRMIEEGLTPDYYDQEFCDYCYAPIPQCKCYLHDKYDEERDRRQEL